MEKNVRKLLACFGLLILISLTIAGCKTKALDEKELFVIKENGSNGYGSLEISINDNYFFSEVVNSDKNLSYLNPYSMSYRDFLLSPEAQSKDVYVKTLYFDSLDYEIEAENENLSNGDVVKIILKDNKKLSKDSGFKLRKNVINYKVSYLPEPKEYDPFADLKVSFIGDDGEGRVELSYDSADPLYIQYEVLDRNGNLLEDFYVAENNKYGLSNGDIITIKADFDSQEAESEGYVIIEDEKTYTVSGLTEYERIDEELLLNFFAYYFEGASPNASMKIENQLPDSLYGFFEYKVEPSTGLKIGDKVTLTVYADQERLKASGKNLPGGSLSQVYELTDDFMPQYLTSFDNISASDRTKLLEEVNNYLIKLKADNADRYSSVNGDSKYVKQFDIGNLEKVVLLHPKPSTIDQVIDNNFYYSSYFYNNLIFIYSVEVETKESSLNAESTKEDSYIAVYFENLIYAKDSGVDIDATLLNNHKLFNTLADIEDTAINKNRDIYSVIELSGSEFN